MPQVNSTSGAAPAKADAPALVISLAWPPLIRWTQVPRMTRVRDLLLTFMAWLCYAVILRRPIVAIIAWVSPALGARLETWLPMDYSVDSGPYLVVAAVLVLALLLQDCVGVATSASPQIPIAKTNRYLSLRKCNLDVRACLSHKLVYGGGRDAWKFTTLIRARSSMRAQRMQLGRGAADPAGWHGLARHRFSPLA